MSEETDGKGEEQILRNVKPFKRCVVTRICAERVIVCSHQKGGEEQIVFVL